MPFEVEVVEDTSPIRSATLIQPEGYLDLTLNKDKKGKGERISNDSGNSNYAANSEITKLIKALEAVVKRGIPVSQQAA